MKALNIKKTLSHFFLISILILTMGCDEEPLDPPQKEDKTFSKEPDAPLPAFEEESEYEEKEFSFNGYTSLTRDLHINARNIYFKLGSRIKINGFQLSLVAENIKFEQQVDLLAYEAREYAACRTHGAHAGEIKILTKTIEGEPFLDLAGQNAGQMAAYYVSDAGGVPIHSSHKKVGHGATQLFLGCNMFAKGYPATNPTLVVPRHGGQNGALFLEAQNHSDFNPVISDRVSHGSYRAVLSGQGDKISWTRDVTHGQNGQPTRLCYMIGSEYLCK